MFIYLITNKNNDKKYIGQTNNPSRRKSQHVHEALKRGRKDKLHTAIREEGRENFKYEILGEFTDEIINQVEKDFIRFFNTIETGYNTKQ